MRLTNARSDLPGAAFTRGSRTDSMKAPSSPGLISSSAETSLICTRLNGLRIRFSTTPVTDPKNDHIPAVVDDALSSICTGVPSCVTTRVLKRIVCSRGRLPFMNTLLKSAISTSIPVSSGQSAS